MLHYFIFLGEAVSRVFWSLKKNAESQNMRLQVSDNRYKRAHYKYYERLFMLSKYVCILCNNIYVLVLVMHI